MNTFQITQMTPEQFEKRIAQIVKDQFESIKSELTPVKEREEYLTRKQVADLFQIELSTLHNWCKK
ncbi:MAG: hypothetical protein WD398_05570 [Cyclobacteriaceae bacterium]